LVHVSQAMLASSSSALGMSSEPASLAASPPLL